MISDAVNNLSSQIAVTKDRIILRELENRFSGTFDLDLLRDRMFVRIRQGVETWELDGQKIVEFYPLQSGTATRDNSTFIEVAQKYKTFREGGRYER